MYIPIWEVCYFSSDRYMGKLTCGNCGHINEVLSKDVLEYTSKCYHCSQELTDEKKEKF